MTPVKCYQAKSTNRRTSSYHVRQLDGNNGGSDVSNSLSYLINRRQPSPMCPRRSRLDYPLSVAPKSALRSRTPTLEDGHHVPVAPARRRWGCVGPAMLAVVLLVAASADRCSAKLSGLHSWQTPGCHRIGHTRRITIPDCVEFDITTNACRGYCESWSVLASHSFSSPFSDQDASSPRLIAPFIDQLGGAGYGPPQQKPQITSVGQCCNIMESEDVKVKVMCVDGPRELAFKSAKTCACFHCKKY